MQADDQQPKFGYRDPALGEWTTASSLQGTQIDMGGSFVFELVPVVAGCKGRPKGKPWRFLKRRTSHPNSNFWSLQKWRAQQQIDPLFKKGTSRQPEFKCLSRIGFNLWGEGGGRCRRWALRGWDSVRLWLLDFAWFGISLPETLVGVWVILVVNNKFGYLVFGPSTQEVRILVGLDLQRTNRITAG